MSTNNEDPGKRVSDEEGQVDTKIKTRIVKTRKRVDDVEEALFVEAATDPNVQISRQEQTVMWSTVVKQYLRLIEPILRSDDVEGAAEYYESEKIGSVELIPPDTDGYQFSAVGRLDESDQTIRRMLGLPRGADVPQPETVTFEGLKSIIEAPDVLEHQWTVVVDRTGPPPEHTRVHPHAQQVISRDLLVDAVRKADQFLQTAGIGLDLEEDDTPIIRGYDQSGDSNDAELDAADYTGDPDI